MKNVKSERLLGKTECSFLDDCIIACGVRAFGKINILDIKTRPIKKVRVAGVIANMRLLLSKKLERYARFMLKDFSGTIDVLISPKLYKECGRKILKIDEMVVVSGTVNRVVEPPDLIAGEIITFKAARKKLKYKSICYAKNVSEK
ncbi:MAG: hypothetical protein Q7K21_04560 [Elusimicrobiota bacterium]|nr:hypothetical protein [Elusimicrobiota bacterium]